MRRSGGFCGDDTGDGEIDEQTKSSISGDSSKDTCQCLSHSLPENVSGTGMGDMGLRRQRL